MELYAVGEALIDFTAMEPDKPLRKASQFARHAGGAPANVAVAVARLGGRSHFVGSVGRDPFGDFLIGTLSEYGVGVEHVTQTQAAPTTLAFVARSGDEPDYFFVRNPGADTQLRSEDLADLTFDEDSVLHLGSNSLAAAPLRDSVDILLTRAQQAGALISFDVNLRPAFWRTAGDAVLEEDSLEEARSRCRSVLERASIVKANRAEWAWLAGASGDASIEQTLRQFARETDAVLIATLGADGTAVLRGPDEKVITTPGFPVAAIDATGAGDAFVGGILYGLMKDQCSYRRLRTLGDRKWTDYTRFGNAVAALNVSRFGAIPAMPSLAEVEALIARAEPDPR